MSEWHQPLYPEEVTGRHHVRVVFNDGTVIDGRLIYEVDTPWMRVGQLRRVPVGEQSDSETESEVEVETPPVLYNADDQNWYPFPDVKSVKVVWDEEEWEQIELHEAVEGDMLVVNGELYPIRKVVPVEDPNGVAWMAGSPAYFMAPFMVSCALRRKETGSNE